MPISLLEKKPLRTERSASLEEVGEQRRGEIKAYLLTENQLCLSVSKKNRKSSPVICKSEFMPITLVIK